MGFNFTSELIEWRGPAPFFFIEVPAKFAVHKPLRIELGDKVNVALDFDC